MGRHGTDLALMSSVRNAVARLVRKQWGGWSVSDREDLEQLVMIKYFTTFGRDGLADAAEGDPVVPVAWLVTVIRNAGVDFHRHREARPDDPVDFQDADAVGLDRLLVALHPRPNLSSGVANRIDLQRMLVPALRALGRTYPQDVTLIEWRFVQDRDVKDIGESLGKSPETTRKAIQRAVQRLRGLIESAPVAQPERSPNRRIGRRG